MNRSPNRVRREPGLIAAAAIVAVVAIELESASRVTMDAVRTSTAIAYRVVAPPGHVKAAAGVSLVLATAALCVVLLTRATSLSDPIPATSRATHFAQDNESSAGWRSRLIRAARSGGSRDR